MQIQAFRLLFKFFQDSIRVKYWKSLFESILQIFYQ